MTSEHKHRDARVLFVLSALYRRLLGAVNSFVKPVFLSPELFGLWNLIALIPRYSLFADLGSREALRFDLPKKLGEGDSEGASTIKASVFSGSLCLSIIVTGCLAVTAALGPFNTVARTGIFSMAAIVMLQWYMNFHVTVLKGQQEFKFLSKFNFLKANVLVGLSALLIMLFSFEGACAALVIAHIVAVIYLVKRHPIAFAIGFDRTVFMQLAVVGMPIMAFNLSNLLMRSIDRFVVVGKLGLEQMGFYALAATALGFLVQVPGASREVDEPRLMREAAALSTSEFSMRHVLSPQLAAAQFMPLIIAPVLYAAPIIIDFALPRYTDGIAPMQILALGSYFLAIAMSLRGVIVLHGWQLSFLSVMVLCLPLNLGLAMGAAGQGLGLPGIAWASMGASIVLALTTVVFLRIRRKELTQSWGIAGLWIILPASWMIGYFLWLAPEVNSACLDLHPSVLLAQGISALINIALALTGHFLLIWFAPLRVRNVARINLEWVWSKLNKKKS